VAHWLYRWLPPSGDKAPSWGQELVIAAWVVAIVALAELTRVRAHVLAGDVLGGRRVGRRRREYGKRSREDRYRSPNIELQGSLLPCVPEALPSLGGPGSHQLQRA